MKNTRMEKLLALGLSATLLLQPIAVFAEDDYNEPIMKAIDTAEEKIEEALPPQEEPVVEEPVAEPAEEPAEEETENPIVAQEPTDTHLQNAEGALERIEENIENYNQTLEDTKEERLEANAAYETAVETARESEETFEQKAEEAIAATWPTIIETGIDAATAHEKADQVVEMSEIVYLHQEEAEAAKADAQILANEAKAAAEDAARVLGEYEDKLDAAEQAKEKADQDYQAAGEAYEAARLARQEAEIEYNKLLNQYGLNNRNYNPEAPNDYWWNYGAYGRGDVRTAIVEAKAALESASSIEDDAFEAYSSLKEEYDDAKDAYDQAAEDAQNALEEKDAAYEAYDTAAKNLRAAELIVAVNTAEAVEMDIYNDYIDWPHWGQATWWDLAEADFNLVKGLVNYKLYDNDNVDAEVSYSIDRETGNVIATYTTEDGEVTRTFAVSAKDEENIHGRDVSGHWLVVKEIVPEERHRDKYVPETYYTDKRNNGEEVEFNLSNYQDPSRYKIVYGNNGKITILTKSGPGGWKEHRTVYQHTRYNKEDEIYYEDVMKDFYTEADHYRAFNGFSKDDAQSKFDEADQKKTEIDNAINNPIYTAGEPSKDEVDAAEKAEKEANTKLEAVSAAYEAVIAAAKKLKDLQSAEKVSYSALTAVRSYYNMAVGQLRTAEILYWWAAQNAGYAQDEANRALAAIENGFEYEIPTPTPTPGPSGEPTGDTTPSDTTDYIPVAPIAVTPAPAAPAPQQAVLGATRTRSGAAATAVEAGEGEEEKKAAPAVEKKQEEKKEETKPAVAIEEEETAKAAAPIATQTPFPWWVLIILAAIAALSVEEYVRRRNAKVNSDSSKKN
ncbi:hypothetical protein [Butyrivibrio sp. NC2007]|uniref:hypothetical protein n=1 Tax=Butyrivibrio sp. NC2007 TaxID=1280683 RepID=UPI0003B57759|nr:hypothetical protein [Butyrivibrio sp. NC2007]